MKKLGVLVGAIACMVALAAPGRAVGPYQILGSQGAAGSDGATRFKLANCDPTLDDSALDGIDSQIVNINGRGNTTLQASWSAEPNLARSLPGSLTAKFYSGDCNALGDQVVVSRQPGGWPIPVPGSTKWLVVVSTYEFTVNFSFP